MEVIHQIIMFIVMVIVGMLFNPMNILAYKLDHLYLSLTLFYGGLLMAANMMCRSCTSVAPFLTILEYTDSKRM